MPTASARTASISPSIRLTKRVGPGTSAQGGIAGSCSYGTISACTSAATVINGENGFGSTPKNAVGGIVGTCGIATDSEERVSSVSRCLYYITKDNYDEKNDAEVNPVRNNGAVRVRLVSSEADIDDMGKAGGAYPYGGITPYADNPADAVINGVKYGDRYYSHIVAIDNNATGTANSTLLAQHEGMIFDVKLRERRLYRDGHFNTLCLPFTLTTNSEFSGTIFDGTTYAGATAMTFDTTRQYYIKGEEEDASNFYRSGISNGRLYLFLQSRGAEPIYAGLPYSVQWTKPEGYDADALAFDISDPVFRNVTIQNTLSPVTSQDGAVTLQPVYDSFERIYEDRNVLYVGAYNTLYYPNGTATVTIRPCRTYFQLNGVQMAEAPGSGDDDEEFIPDGGGDARAFVVDLEDTSGIPSISRVATETGTMFSLSGLRVAPGSQPKPGLYIVNGKKVFSTP